MLFCLSLGGKARDSLQIANDPRCIVQVCTTALGTPIKPVLADRPTGFAQGVWNVKGEIVAPCSNCSLQEQTVLLLRQMLIQIDVTGGASIQITSEETAMHLELIQHIH